MNMPQFLEKISKSSSSDIVNNIYSNKICLNNLKIYLNNIKNTKTILIGEAPGYKGCRNTGIPFTSEYILIKNNFNIPIFGSKKGYKQTTNHLEKEITATIFWKTLKELNHTPLTWNIFPFHPHKLNNKNSNRKPNKEEIEKGKIFLVDLLRLFNIKEIIAVGNLAHNGLNELNIKHQTIRHPSYGGKKEFEEGMKNILNK